MNEMTIRLDKNGAAAVPGGQLLLGYAGNRGKQRKTACRLWRREK